MRFIKAIITVFIAIVVGWFVAGCGGGGPGAKLEELNIFPQDFLCREGDSVDMTAAGSYSNGVTRYVTREAAWSSSDTDVGDIDANGRFIAHQRGVTEIHASLNEVTSNTVRVDVEPIPVVPTSDYLPLAIDNQWRYTGTEVVTDGVEPVQVQVTLTLTVSTQTVRGGVVWYEVLAKASDPLEPPGHLFFRHYPEGLKQYDRYADMGVTVLDGQLQEGVTWQHPDDSDRTYEIVSTRDEVQVPAGTYKNCVQVVETDTYFDPPNVVKAWYKSGVGIVLERQYEGNTLINEQELLGFEPG